MADKSIGRRMYENVMGTPEQNAEAEKRMAEQDKKNPDTAQAKLNRVAKAVTGKKSEPKEDYSYTQTTGKKLEPKEDYSYTQTTGKKLEPKEDYSYTQTMKEVMVPRNESRGRAERTNPMGDTYKKGGMTASKRADGIAQRGKTRGKMV
jgi:hypothetical protein